MPLQALLVFVIICVDYLSKYWVQKHIPLMSLSSPAFPYGGIGVIESFLGVQFSIVHATNTGAAWSLFSDYSTSLFFLRIGLIFGLIYFFLNEKSSLLRWPIALIIAGALGNIFDIFLYGHVIDMIYFVLWGYSYPVYNIADSAICLGVFSYIFLSWIYQNDTEANVK